LASRTDLRFIKVALVTGAASGIGRATALAYARRGAKVVVADINPYGSEEVAHRIQQQGGEALAVTADVASSEDVEQMVKRAVRAYGRLDYAFNNAGIEGVMAPTADYEEAQWNCVIAVNLTGVWRCMKHEIPHLLRRGGAIVNMASILGTVGFANAAAYTAAKHGVVGLTRAAALEYASQGLRINVVCPAFIQTPMLERAGILEDEAAREQLIQLHPIGRMGTAEEVAAVVIWLSEDAPAFVNGHALLVDGGYTAQ
jgi:NAD(P)-dependent dehydrogenase (short-subunit alcohol dehydrogenase family)